jgi:hypothetical protein
MAPNAADLLTDFIVENILKKIGMEVGGKEMANKLSSHYKLRYASR